MSTPPSASDPGHERDGREGAEHAPTSPPPVVPPTPQTYAPPGAAGYGYAPAREHAPGAVAALVCGILGLFTIPLVLSIIAVVLGNQSKRATEAEPHRYSDQFGQVGRILGWIGIGLAALGLLFFAAVLLFLVPFGGSVLRV